MRIRKSFSSVTKLLSLFLLCSLFSACFAPKVLRQEEELFKNTVLPDSRIQQHHFEFGLNRLFYAAAGDAQKPALIIMHGTPGDWQQYARYLLDERLLKHFYMIVIDRPGWGQSILAEGQQIADFDLHSDMLSALSASLKRVNGNQPVLIMGHSLGASIAPKVAMNHPEAIDGLLLFAGTLSPALSQPRWFNRVAENPIVNRLIGETLRKSNIEILALEREMIAMSSQWQNLQVPTLVVQGMKDELVYPDNILFAENKLNARFTDTLRLEEDGHLFPMTRRDDVAKWAICILEKAQASVFTQSCTDI